MVRQHEFQESIRHMDDDRKYKQRGYMETAASPGIAPSEATGPNQTARVPRLTSPDRASRAFCKTSLRRAVSTVYRPAPGRGLERQVSQVQRRAALL